MITPEPTTAETVKTALTATSVISHLKNNRIEYLLLTLLAHFLGVSERVLAQLNGVCI